METHSDPESEPARAEHPAGTPEAREERAAILGFVAHEIRNPLSTALWSAELLARMSPGDRAGPRGEKLTAMSLRALARVRQTIEDHFLVERLDVGGLPIRLEEVDLGDVVPAAAAKVPGATVEIAVERGLFAQADPTLIERAIESLVAAASAGGTAVRVVGTAQGATATVRFEGAPPGPDTMRDPRKGSPSDPRGRSLAISVARRIAAALHGRLDADAGAFVLTLPTAEAYSAAPR